jgi:hypothetical protein
MRIRISVLACFFSIPLTFLLPCSAKAAPPPRSPLASAASPVIVIGFVGGHARHDDDAYLAVRLAARLKQDYASGVYVQVFENRFREKANRKILYLLDADRDGLLSSDEMRHARIVLYGQSWGASETVALAKELKHEGIPVLLTIQVDSVHKFGENDKLIPDNVAEAVNFYQPHGLVHGRRRIRAENPETTRILGNYKIDYNLDPVACQNYPWFASVFFRPHTEIECDPRIWTRIDSLIRSKLPSSEASASSSALSDLQ